MIVVGDYNTRHTKWDTTTNARGKAINSLKKTTILQSLAPTTPTFRTRNGKGSNTPETLFKDLPAPSVTFPNGQWTGASDHCPILYKTSLQAPGNKKPRQVTHTLLGASQGKEICAKFYNSHFPKLISFRQNCNSANVQLVYQQVTETVLFPWQQEARRRSKTANHSETAI